MSTEVEVTSDKSLDLSDSREIGTEATFSISSAKPGNGVEQLRDNNLDSYWQSDGSFPHHINIQFMKRASVSKICLYLDYSADESYTPKKLSISSGTSLHDLSDVAGVELNEPSGWVIIPLANSDGECGGEGFLRTHFLQVKVLSMHQNGRDSHVRHIKVLGPRSSPVVMGEQTYDSFNTVTMQQFSLIR
jgi:anaphase-promoting complex subunit 10